MENNALIKAMRENPATKGGKPMTNQNTFKLLEDLMDQKFEADKKDIEEKK